MLPPGGSICGILTQDLSLGCLQGGFKSSKVQGCGGCSPVELSRSTIWRFLQICTCTRNQILDVDMFRTHWGAVQALRSHATNTIQTRAKEIAHGQTSEPRTHVRNRQRTKTHRPVPKNIVRSRARRQQFERFEGPSPGSQGHNLALSGPERIGNNLKCVKGFHLQVKARIWPWKSYLWHMRSKAGGARVHLHY